MEQQLSAMDPEIHAHQNNEADSKPDSAFPISGHRDLLEQPAVRAPLSPEEDSSGDEAKLSDGDEGQSSDRDDAEDSDGDEAKDSSGDETEVSSRDEAEDSTRDEAEDSSRSDEAEDSAEDDFVIETSRLAPRPDDAAETTLDVKNDPDESDNITGNVVQADIEMEINGISSQDPDPTTMTGLRLRRSLSSSSSSSSSTSSSSGSNSEKEHSRSDENDASDTPPGTSCDSLALENDIITPPSTDQLSTLTTREHSNTSPSQLPAKVTFHVTPMRSNEPPATQTMERPNVNNDPKAVPEYRIPSYVFARQRSAAPMDQWSVTSNESLFSIHMGNASFNRDQLWLGKSGELGTPNSFVDFTVSYAASPAPVTTPASIMSASSTGQNSARMDEEFRAAEAKAAETMREVIRENAENIAKEAAAAAAGVTTAKEPLPSSKISRIPDDNTKSFAFPGLSGEIGGKSASSKGGAAAKQARANSSQPPAAVANAPRANPMVAPYRWLRSYSCFTCCRPSCF